MNLITSVCSIIYAISDTLLNYTQLLYERCMCQTHYNVCVRLTTMYVSDSLRCLCQTHYNVCIRLTTMYVSDSLQCMCQTHYNVGIRLTTIYVSDSLQCMCQTHYMVCCRGRCKQNNELKVITENNEIYNIKLHELNSYVLEMDKKTEMSTQNKNKDIAIMYQSKRYLTRKSMLQLYQSYTLVLKITYLHFV